MNELETILRKALGKFEEQSVTLQKAGKSAVLRTLVPVLDFHQPFEDQVDSVEDCFKGIVYLTKISNMLPSDDITTMLIIN